MPGFGTRYVRKPADWDYASEHDLLTTCRWNPTTETGVCRIRPSTLRSEPCAHVTSSAAYRTETAE